MQERKVFPGELALLLGLVCNSLGVSIMVKSGFGISSISSVPYVLSRIWQGLSFGVWNYLFQSALIAVLMLLVRRFKAGYVLSFFLAVCFGYMIDFFDCITAGLPTGATWHTFYFLVSFCLLAVGICLLFKCGVPILPIDTFTRDITAHFHIPYPVVKTLFDLVCLAVTCALSLLLLQRIVGVGVGTVLCAFVTGKCVSLVGRFLDQRFVFVPLIKKLGEV